MAATKNQKNIAIAIVIVLTALIVAIAAKKISQYRKKKRDRYVVGNPAAPRQRDAVRDLSVHLRSLVKLGESFQTEVGAMTTEEKKMLPAGPALVTVVKSVTDTLQNTEQRLKRAPLTYANLLGFYRGLSGSDQKMLSTATSLETAGHTIHQTIDRANNVGWVEEANMKYGTAGTAGIALIEFAREIRGLLISVHRLGSALDVE